MFNFFSWVASNKHPRKFAHHFSGETMLVGNSLAGIRARLGVWWSRNVARGGPQRVIISLEQCFDRQHGLRNCSYVGQLIIQLEGPLHYGMRAGDGFPKNDVAEEAGPN